MKGPSSLSSRQDRGAISRLSTELAGIQSKQDLSMASGLDTAFVEMIEQAEFHWPERLSGEKIRIGSAEIGTIVFTLDGFAVLARHAMFASTRPIDVEPTRNGGEHCGRTETRPVKRNAEQ
jgi:hypothetical protein